MEVLRGSFYNSYLLDISKLSSLAMCFNMIHLDVVFCSITEFRPLDFSARYKNEY